MANILILDFFNLIKRYTSILDEDQDEGSFYSDTISRIVNRLLNLITVNKIDLFVVCSDSGFNHRANSILGGNYKANRNRAKSQTEEEREKNCIEKVKKILQAMPSIFLEVKDVEADNIIYFVVDYFRKRLENTKFLVASSDSDLLQLLDSDLSINKWGSKELITIDNWKELNKFDCKYFKPKDYALFKAIVGDNSDNIKGINGIGWKKGLSFLNFLYSKLGKDLEINNFTRFIGYIDEVSKYDLNKKERALVDKFKAIIEENLDQLTANFSVISLDMLETPYVFKILQSLESAIRNKIMFSQEKFLSLIKFKDQFSSDVDYTEIRKKNLRGLYEFKKLVTKSNGFLKNLIDVKKNKEDGV